MEESSYFIILIYATYGEKCQVLYRGKTSEDFELQRGVHQGCVLSPNLFLRVNGNLLRS